MVLVRSRGGGKLVKFSSYTGIIMKCMKVYNNYYGKGHITDKHKLL